METYAFIFLVALFLAVASILAMLEYRRRTELAQFGQLHKALSDCLGTLQAIHSSNGTQMVQIAEAIGQLRTAVEAGAKNTSDTASAIVKNAVVHLESALLQHQKAQDAASQSIASKFSDVTRSTSKELLSEAQRMTKAVQDLQASLEASAKF